jgi:Predicted O-methyltransferase
MQMQPDQESQHFYALELLTEQVKAISGGADNMSALRASVEKHLQKNLEKAKSYFMSLLQERQHMVKRLQAVRSALLELEEYPLAEKTAQMSEALAAFNMETKDYSQLVSVLKGYAESLPTNQKASAAVIGRLMNQVRMGYYPTESENVDHILKGITFPDGITTNLFDPCCGEGLALRKLAEGNNCYTYGIELDESRAEQAQSRLHRVGFGSYFSSRMSNEAFHLMLLNPPYLNAFTEGGGRTREEKRFLVESIARLMMGGLLLYIVPYYRLTSDICQMLCDNFEELSAYKFVGPEFERFKQVVVMGLRRPRELLSDGARELEAMVCDASVIPAVDTIEAERYALPAVSKSVQLFKGAVFNQQELAQQLMRSNSIQRLLEQRSELDRKERRPPLPLGINQIGLVGGSGEINGLIDCATPHIIKGRIVKECKYSTEEFRDGSGRLLYTEECTTTSNKMIFNVLTPEGFLALT